jgi:quercetin dioxygenase-like cupin family protein
MSGALMLLGAMALAGSAAPARGAETPEMVMVEPQSLKFAPVPGIPGCATAAPVRGDPSKGPSVLLIKLAGGCRVPWHWHSANEQLMIVSGAGTLEMKDGKSLKLRPGAYAFLPNHQVHQASCSANCMFFNSSDGVFDVHYVDQAGKEITPDEALKSKAKK